MIPEYIEVNTINAANQPYPRILNTSNIREITNEHIVFVYHTSRTYTYLIDATEYNRLKAILIPESTKEMPNTSSLETHKPDPPEDGITLPTPTVAIPLEDEYTIEDLMHQGDLERQQREAKPEDQVSKDSSKWTKEDLEWLIRQYDLAHMLYSRYYIPDKK